jgi:hypothetical protein
VLTAQLLRLVLSAEVDTTSARNICGPVCTDNLNAGVAVMKSAQDGA